MLWKGGKAEESGGEKSDKESTTMASEKEIQDGRKRDSKRQRSKSRRHRSRRQRERRRQEAEEQEQEAGGRGAEIDRFDRLDHLLIKTLIHGLCAQCWSVDKSKQCRSVFCCE